jgi:hypothetical protein
MGERRGTQQQQRNPISGPGWGVFQGRVLREARWKRSVRHGEPYVRIVRRESGWFRVGVGILFPGRVVYEVDILDRAERSFCRLPPPARTRVTTRPGSAGITAGICEKGRESIFKSLFTCGEQLGSFPDRSTITGCDQSRVSLKMLTARSGICESLFLSCL